jgi:hypothetical protein
MRNTARQTRENRTITIDFQNEATYVQLPAFCATKGAFIEADSAPKRTPARSIFLS